MASLTARSARAAAGPRQRFDSLAQAAYLHLWRTYDRLRAWEDALFAAEGLTAQQYNALRLLRAEQPAGLPSLTLGSRLISRAPDITRLVDGLESRGMVSRERPAENRRQVWVRITPAGVRLLDRLAEPVRQCHQKQLGHLPAGQLRELIDLLERARAPHEAPGSRWAPAARARPPRVRAADRRRAD